MGVMQQVTVQRGFTLSYELRGNGSKKAVVIPAGVDNQYDFSFLNDLLPSHQILLVYIPGSAKTVCEDDQNNIHSISCACKKLIKKLGFENAVGIGFSYGGTVLIECVRTMSFRKLVLVQAGEFFSWWQKVALSIICFPTTLSATVAWYYTQLYGVLGFGNFSKVNKKTSKMLARRWYRILWYQLPKVRIETPTLLVFSPLDWITTSQNQKKLSSMFIYHQTVHEKAHHGNYHAVFSSTVKKKVKKFLT